MQKHSNDELPLEVKTKGKLDFSSLWTVATSDPTNLMVFLHRRHSRHPRRPRKLSSVTFSLLCFFFVDVSLTSVFAAATQRQPFVIRLFIHELFFFLFLPNVLPSSGCRKPILHFRFVVSVHFIVLVGCYIWWTHQWQTQLTHPQKFDNISRLETFAISLFMRHRIGIVIFDEFNLLRMLLICFDEIQLVPDGRLGWFSLGSSNRFQCLCFDGKTVVSTGNHLAFRVIRFESDRRFAYFERILSAKPVEKRSKRQHFWQQYRYLEPFEVSYPCLTQALAEPYPSTTSI